jgi:hypothetical protein
MQLALQQTFQAADAATATPEQPASAQPTPEPAIAAPVAETPEAPVVPENAQSEAAGPIPFDRHKAALENARTKTREEVTAQLEKQYAPIREFAQKFHSDPVASALQLMQELQANPFYAPQLTSAAARMLASQRGKTADSAMPEPDLQTPDGMKLYSADQLAKRDEWLTNKLLAQVRGELAPVQQQYQQQQALQAQQQHRAQTAQAVKSLYESWKARPHFEDHKEDIAVAQKRLVDEGVDYRTAIGLAYAEVMDTIVRPKLQAQTHTSLVKKAVDKAAASTSNPAAVAPAPPGRPKSMRDALEKAFANVG